MQPGKTACLQRLVLKCGYRIGEVCASLECSERYFYKVFLDDVGLPPKEWMRNERMVVARRMLAGGRSPGDVALALGFSAVGNFRREFQAFHQVTPACYQRETWRR
ncbi:MAG: helix-turn-helix transcriptional regulator [Luteolibacter sp.]|uniref:helix-turn-helix transcriptional regulator n=1 Tax=Luteolibacter sp. TaxID=1962973 RepID=UPI003265F914